MYCVKCGQQVPEGDRFCTRCGAPMELPVSSAAQPVPVPPPAPQPAPAQVTRPTPQPAPAPAAQPAPQPAPAWAATQPLRYAGFWRRFAAALIDGAIVGLLWFVLSGVYEFATSRLLETTAFAPDGMALTRALWLVTAGRWALGMALVLLCFALPEGTRRGASPGKLALRLRVARSDGGRAGITRSMLRTALKPLSAAPLMLGFVIAGWNPRRRALHDMLSGSVVLRV